MVSDLAKLTRSLRGNPGLSGRRPATEGFRLAIQSRKNQLKTELATHGKAEFEDRDGNKYLIVRSGGDH